MTQEQIAKDYICGAKEGISSGAGNLKIQGDKLIHYSTLISERQGNRFIVNVTRYSLVTGRIQKMLREKIPQELVVTAHKVPEGTTTSLQPFIKTK